MVRAERQSDVVRRARHRHRHDGRWRGRDGGKHPSASDGETAIRREHHSTADKIETVLYAAKEVGRPIVFGIFIIIIVFLPLFTLKGFEGKMFSPLAFTISFALLGSLIFSLTLVPMLCTLFLKQEPHAARSVSHSLAEAGLPHKHSNRACVILAGRAHRACLHSVGAFALVPLIGTEFLPALDEGSIAVQTFRIPSISLPQSLALQTQGGEDPQTIS